MDNRVLQWLASIPPAPATAPPSHSRKRKRASFLPTPPPDSIVAALPDMMKTPSKRAAAAPEDDETPRAERSNPQRSAPSLSSATSSRASGSSRASDNKRRRQMESGAEPLVSRSFARVYPNENSLPESLRLLELEFRHANSGKPIISQSRRAEIRAAGPAAESIFDGHFLPDDDDVGPGSPPFQDVLRLQRRAGRYASERYEESAWGSGIVFPILELAIPDDEQLVLVPCTSARVADKDLLPSGFPNGKMVDFCLAIDPEWTPATATGGTVSDTALGTSGTDTQVLRTDTAALSAAAPRHTDTGSSNTAGETAATAVIERMQCSLPHHTINHTDHKPLSQKPIALSIEIKRPSGDAEEAQLQLGVWQYAQWKQLQSLTSMEVDREPRTDEDQLAGLDFLPGIYIVGHQWRFSATVKTKKTGKVVQWIDGALGHTESAHGIYCIVWAVRRLAAFLAGHYWPWFQTRVLRLRG